ncbi:MAG: NAD-dependent epimerase/dehydratase family protein [Burkholderiaceae bacterium]
MSNDSEKVLITGGNGNLGRLVANKLLASGRHVITFDTTATEPASAHANETVISGDIRDTGALQTILTEHRPKTIYHLASLLSGSSEANLTTAWEVNATASFHLLRLANEHKIPQFFFASTVGTYGLVDTTSMPEDYPQWPENFYGVTKVAVERLGVYFKIKHGLDFRCLRFPLVVSPFAPQGALSAYPSHAFKAAFNHESFCFPVAAEVGISTLFLEDAVDSIVQFTNAQANKLTRHVYNLHGYFLSAGEVAEAAAQRFPGFDYSFESIDAIEQLIAGGPDIIDDSAARRDWSWQPQFDFAKSADRICELLRAGACVNVNDDVSNNG